MKIWGYNSLQKKTIDLQNHFIGIQLQEKIFLTGIIFNVFGDFNSS